MNIKKVKLISVILAFILVFTLCSCFHSEREDSSVVSAKSLIVKVDGKNITIEEAEGKTIEELLKDAKISLNDGDVLSIDTDVKLADNMVVKVLRRADVTIKDTINDVEYEVVLTGSTVSDALSAVGIELADNHTINHKTDDALKDGMKIVVSIKEEPETTEPYSEEPQENNNYVNNDYYDDDSDNSDSGYTPPPPVTKPATTKPATTKPPVTKEPTTKAPEPTTSGRTIVSVEIYEDCDGSGHGVKVITYSDGTQEEVPF